MSSLRPSRPSEPPPDSDPGPSSGPGPLPMSVFLATLWGIAAYAGLNLVAGLLPTRDALSIVGAQAVAYLLVLFGVLRVHEPESSIRSVVGLRTTHPGFFPLALAIGVAVNPPLQRAYVLLQRRWPVEDEPDQLEFWVGLGASGQLRAALAMVVFTPILEEILCRGGLFGPLVKRHDRFTAVVVTAFVFGMLHRPDVRVLPIVAFGLVLGLLRSESGSLVPSVLAHFSFNLAGVIELQRAAIGRPIGFLTDPSNLVVGVCSGATVLLLVAVRLLAARSESARLSRGDDERRLA